MTVGRIMKLDKFSWVQEFWFQVFWNMPLCWWFSIRWCFWRNVLPSSSRVEGSSPLELLSPWMWRHHIPLKCQDTLTCWQWRHSRKYNPKVFLRFIELKLLSQDTLSKQRWDKHLYETLCHFESISWHYLYFPCYECATLPGIRSQSQHVLQSVKQLISEKKVAFEKFWFCVESIDSQHFVFHLSLVFKFQILVLVELYYA